MEWLERLTNAQYRTLAAVVSLDVDHDGIVGASARQVAAVTGRHFGTVARHLAALVDAGALELLEHGQWAPNGRRRATVYAVTWFVPRLVDNHVQSRGQRRAHRDSQSRAHRDTPPLRGDGAHASARAHHPAAGRLDLEGAYHPGWCGCRDCSAIAEAR